MELKQELTGEGHLFQSRTDTEVIPHLIEDYLSRGLGFIESVREAVKWLEGAYTIAVIFSEIPNKIVFARKASPLVLGVSEDILCASSDIPTILPLTNRIIEVHNGEMVILSEQGVELRWIEDWSLVEREAYSITWSVEMAQKQGFPHFMLKEIHEQSQSLRNTLLLQESYLDLLTTFLDRGKDVYLLACGTSYHSCLAASYMFSNLCNLSTIPTIASEFIEQHGEAVNIDSTILAVSQSGETADVLHAIDHARSKTVTILGLTNTMGSTLTRVSRAYISQQSGPEIGVAATKTFTSQLMVLAQLAIRLAKARGKVSQERMDYLEEKLVEIPDFVEKIILLQGDKIKSIVQKYQDKSCFYFLGRGISTTTALEGRLKLLEIAYMPSIAYPAGESKNGAISLVQEGFPIIFVCPPDSTRKALIGNIMEMKARGGKIIAVIEETDDEIKQLVDDYFEVPYGVPEILSPIPYVIPLQLFAYYMAVEKGLNPDKPRNLAKSVTVL
jgi:glucosamine--fructose-6-phosphate aminotransferase (isomerizing)